MAQESHRWLLRYGVAILSTAVALGVTWFFSGFFEPYAVVAFLLVVAASSWYGGAGPGLLSLVLGGLAIDYAVLEPTYSLSLEPATLLQLGLYGIAALVIGALQTQSHRAQNVARRSKQQFEQMRVTLESIGEAVVATDIQGHITFLNPVAEALTGWSEAEAKGQLLSTVFHIVSEEAGENVEGPLQRVERDGQIAGLSKHTLLIARDGTQTPIDESAAPIRDSSNRTIGTILVFRDTTERRRAEERQRFLSQASEILASSLDYETTLASVARLAVPQIADWCVVDIVGETQPQRLAVAHVDPAKVETLRDLQRRYPPDPDAPHGLARVLRTGEVEIHQEISDELLKATAQDEDHLKALQELGFKSTTIVPLMAQREILGAITLVSAESGRQFNEADIELARELARRAALAVDNAQLYRDSRERRERLRVTLESIGDAVIVTDTRGRITFLNPVAEALTGWQEQDAIGERLNNVFRILDEATRQPLTSPVEQALREERTVTVADSTVLIAKDGTEIPIDESGAPIVGDDDKVMGAILVFRDITERRQAQLQLEKSLAAEAEARHEAERANQLKMKFLGMISHELRTPLASIKGFATTLLADDVSWEPQDQRDFIQTISEEADKLTDLISQLLDLSRLEAGVLSINRKPETVSAILEMASPQLSNIAAKHRLEIEAAEDLPRIHADPQRISQVITNLVDNAAKYTPEGTSITIAASVDGDHVQIDVCDEGPGIPLAERETVFEAFHQARKHHDNEEKGAGLGLAIARSLIEAHGGRVWIADQESPGLTVSFTVPIAPPLEKSGDE